MDMLTKEAVRYLGYKNSDIDERTLELIKESFQELNRVVRKRWIYRIYDLNETGNRLQFANIETDSKNLHRNLEGCDQVILFGATLGIETDFLMTRMAVLDMAKTVVMQACATALLEEFCDQCQEELAQELKKENYYLRPRFSPGYGDFDIKYQENIMKALDCAKKIGLTLTDSCMMSPKKSVTALIGISHMQRQCMKSGCEICKNKECNFRRS